MKLVPELNLGSIDAINYKQRSDKDFLSQILYRERFLDEIIEHKKYFVIGDKGTGKTSYATFLQNTDYRDVRSTVVSLSATDYTKFIKLREQDKFQISSYSDVWKTILLLLVSHGISERELKGLFSFPKFNKLQEAIGKYYNDAFKPEVDYSLELISNSEEAYHFISKFFKADAKETTTDKSKTFGFQLSLKGIQDTFQDVISSLKLSKDFILFIDGIDIRPGDIEFKPYIECIRGLAHATWQLNTEFFANVRDSKGRIKICLLMRPDILDHMDFQNLNAKVQDNGVILDWQTSFTEYGSSGLFLLMSGLLGKQQVPPVDGKAAWRHYFPFKVQDRLVSEKLDDPFVTLLRYSFHRPRDIVQFLKLMQEYIRDNSQDKSVFTLASIEKRQREHSDYLLGEVKDYLSFYFSTVDFDELVGFFSHLGGRGDFSWEQFIAAHKRYQQHLGNRDLSISAIRSSPEQFLQFLYSLNFIGSVERTEGRTFVHYCFRDRTPVKLRPKVRTGLSYSVHPGLARALTLTNEWQRTRR